MVTLDPLQSETNINRFSGAITASISPERYPCPRYGPKPYPSAYGTFDTVDGSIASDIDYSPRQPTYELYISYSY